MKKVLTALMLVALVSGCANSAGPGFHKPNTPAQIAVSDSVRGKIKAAASTKEVNDKQLEGYVVLRFEEGVPRLMRTSGRVDVDREAIIIARKVASQMTAEERSYNLNVGVLFEVGSLYEGGARKISH
jgi:hypothetical protein